MESRSRWLCVGLALAAAFAFALSVQSTWWSISGVIVGPFGTHNCPGGSESCGFGWLSHDALFLRAAVATRAAGYIAMFLYIMVAGAVAAKRTPLLVSRAGIVSIIVAVAAGGAFVVRFPSSFGEKSIGLGPFVYALAIVCGLCASIFVFRSSAHQRAQR